MCGILSPVLQGAGGAVVSVVKADPQTGRLVRAVVRSAPAKSADPDPEISAAVDRIAQENQLSPRLVHSVIQVESNYDPNAISPKGALGLMQLIPSTARRFGVSDVFDPADNIQGGTKYLKYLLALYDGDEALALAAYNAGEKAVARYGGIPPYPETQAYVTNVRRRAAKVTPAPKETPAAAANVQATNDNAAETPAVTYNPIEVVTGANGKVYYISH